MHSNGSSDFLITVPATDKAAGRALFDAISGITPQQRAEWKADGERRAREADEKHRREIEAMRDRMCALVSPKLAAEWRAKWALEDAERDQRDERRAA